MNAQQRQLSLAELEEKLVRLLKDALPDPQ